MSSACTCCPAHSPLFSSRGSIWIRGWSRPAAPAILIPYLTSTSQPAVRAPIQLSPPIGVKGVSYKPSVFTLEHGHGLVIYSDGLVERRGESIDDNMDRLAEAVGHASHASASWIRTVTSENTHDDVTIVTLHRP